MNRITQTCDYIYRNCPIPGGGYVTGFLFHPKEQDLLYLRTDIGGVYRYVPALSGWKSLVEHVTTTKIDETFPIAIATDPADPDRLYILCGAGASDTSLLCISYDRGESFRYATVPVPAHGNWPGRGTGVRLVVDPVQPHTLYFASQKNGLLRTNDLGNTWEKLPVPEDYLTFVYVSEDGERIIVGSAGVTTAPDSHTRGHSLYISYDRGAAFEAMPVPASSRIPGSVMDGLVAHRYCTDYRYFYVTFNASGLHNYVKEMGYSCDSGAVLDGHILRYDLRAERMNTFEEITPAAPSDSLFAADDTGRHYLRYGFGGISATPARPGLLVCSTLSLDHADGECVYRSFDYGNTWEKVLQGLTTGKIAFQTEYMRPEYNGNRSLIHWLSDIKLNPHSANDCWFNTGTGVFHSSNFTQNPVLFTDENTGLEETVHLNVYAPVAGEVQLVDILGDLGGFAFRAPDRPCANSFADAEGNRYITCINADLSDADPNLGIVTARGNWSGRTKGGLIRTTDNFRTFTRLPMPYGISDKLDYALAAIERPNTNPGWVAMSPDGQNIVWSVADGIHLPADQVLFSNDRGASFSQSRILSADGSLKSDGCFKVFSDRMQPELFYGFDEASRVYLSTDGGSHFYEKKIEGKFPSVDFGLIDTINKTEVRGEGGRSGIFYIALGTHGLYKLILDPEADVFHSLCLTRPGDKVYRMGLGLSRESGDYLSEPKAIYFCGEIDGQYGFFRTTDEGRSFVLLNNEKQHFGEINSIDGDKRIFGRFFIATGTRGVKYGEPL